MHWPSKDVLILVDLYFIDYSIYIQYYAIIIALTNVLSVCAMVNFLVCSNSNKDNSVVVIVIGQFLRVWACSKEISDSGN